MKSILVDIQHLTNRLKEPMIRAYDYRVFRHRIENPDRYYEFTIEAIRHETEKGTRFSIEEFRTAKGKT